MTKRFRTATGWLVLAASAVTILLAPTTPALANIITFSTAPSGPGFTGPVTEAGFTYSTLSGALYVNDYGNPGNDMEGSAAGGGGVLQIVSATAGDFNFNTLDFAAYSQDPSITSLTLTVTGLLGGSTVGTDTYTLATTENHTPNGLSYANWTTESANILAGQTLSQLDISLVGLTTNNEQIYAAIDNVVLTPLSSVPEPGSLALLAAGLLGLGFVMWRRKIRTDA